MTPFFQTRPTLRPAPRAVSTGARLRLMFGGARQVYWLVALFLSLFFWIFCVDSELFTPIVFRGELRRTQGTVSAVGRTSASENKRTIMAVEFDYEVEGARHHATSHAVRNLPATGSRVEVEYVVARPGTARVVGLRARKFGSGIFVLIPFLVAVALTLRTVVRGVADAGLLARGEVALARLVNKQPTGSRVNKQPVHRYTFEVELPVAAVGSYRGGGPPVRTHRFEVKTHEGRELEDEPLEPVVFDRARPGRGLALDALGITVTPGGDGDAPGSQGVLLLLPSLFVIGHGLALLISLT